MLSIIGWSKRRSAWGIHGCAGQLVGEGYRKENRQRCGVTTSLLHPAIINEDLLCVRHSCGIEETAMNKADTNPSSHEAGILPRET